MAEENDVVIESDSSGVRFTETIEEAQEKIAEAEEPTPEDFGVDKASFDKYYNDGEFDWASYGKEQAWKQRQKPEQEPEPEPRKSEAPRHSDTPAAQEAVEQAGLDWDELGAKISNEGDLSESDYEALGRLGIPNEVVQGYVDMVRRETQGIIDDIIDRAGGQDVFDQAYDVLQDKDYEVLRKIDDLLLDPSTREYGIDMMFKEAGINPTQPAQPQAQPYYPEGRASPAANVSEPFSSVNEQVQAMRDPKYRTDIAYRNQVLERIKASNYDIGTGHLGGL